MKVALISHGKLIHVRPYLEYMVQAGWEVHWIQVAPPSFDVPGLTVHQCYPKWSSTSTGTVSKVSYFISGLMGRRLLKKINPDIVSAHYASSGGLVAWLSGFRPYVVTIHGSDLIQRSHYCIGRFLLRGIFRHAALVNSVCEHVAGTLESLGIHRDSVLVLPFGIELRDFPFCRHENPFASGVRIVCPRSLEQVYDIPTVIRGVAEARRRNVDAMLTLPAGGKLQPELERLTKKLGIAEAVTFGGGYNRQELQNILARHDVYVSASLWDGASLSLMEAMACGIFPVVSDIPANSEWLKDGENALMFPCGDWKFLGELLASLPQRKDMVECAVLRNRQIIEERADRKVNLQKFMDMLESMTG